MAVKLQTGRRAVSLEADIGSVVACRQLVDDVVDRFGRIDLLVHNAATFVTRPFLELTEDDYEKSMGVILRGPFFLSQAAARYMVEQGSGKIIALLGNSLYESWPEYVTHTLAKSAMGRLVELLAVALSPHVQTLGVAPDKVLVTEPDSDNQQHPVVRGESISGSYVTVPGGVQFRTGTAEEVASAVVELARSSAYVNGVILPLDGGKSRY